MNRRLVLAAAALAAATAVFADGAPATRVSGTVLTAEVSSDPFEEGSGAGSLVIVDKDGHPEEYSVLGTTRLTRDGKKVKFDTALIGDLIVQAQFDPQTKVLTVLDLKSAAAPIPWNGAAAPKPKAAKAPVPAHVKGEVAFADAVKGLLSVRTRKGRTRKFSIGAATTVLREREDGTAIETGFETVAVGDAVEVRSRDGKTADQIRVRAAAR